jgi:hypothetical protein
VLTLQTEEAAPQKQSVQGLYSKDEKEVEIAAENRAALVRLEQQMEQKDGFLEKKGSWRNWKRYYFVWTPADNALRYYSESAFHDVHRSEYGPFCSRRN